MTSKTERVSSVRRLALEILYKAETTGAFVNRLLERALGENPLSSRDKGLLTEIAYGVVRRKNTLDWIIERYSTRSLSRMTPWIGNILRMGVYQLFYMDKIPPYAVLNESVQLAHTYGHRGTAKFVNGVLRKISRELGHLEFPSLDRDLVSHVSLRYSHPPWLVERWIDRFGSQETIKLCQANNEVPPLTIRVNTLKTDKKKLTGLLEKEGVKMRPGRMLPGSLRIEGFSSLSSLDAYKQGYFFVQDESSMLAAHLLSPRAGETVIDLCSAPGGKATHFAQLMDNKGIILALDTNSRKLSLLKDNCRRLGVDIIKTYLQDACRIKDVFAGKADRILVDVPCSNLGALRRRVEAKWRLSSEKISELRELQLEILTRGAESLKPGGVLLYSTCTLMREENEEVVNKFLERCPGFEIDDFYPDFVKSLVTKEGFLRTYPHRHGMDGVFLARMKKRA